MINRRDLLTAALGIALFLAAALEGRRIMSASGNVGARSPLFLDWPPLYAEWAPHWGAGTVAAVTIAAAVIAYGPALAERLAWRQLLLGGWLASMAWLWALALIDGWQRGIAGQLADKHEYLVRDLGRWEDVGQALRTFTDFILLDAPDNWQAHVAGHPPGAILTFVGLDRIGLGGATWGAVFILTTAGSAAVAVLIALRALGDEELARRAAPFLVLAPWAVWAGVSADGYFAAVAAWGLALLALAASRSVRWPIAAGLGAGLLLGWLIYLSYGMALMAFVALAVLYRARALRPLPWVLLGAGVIVAVFTLNGFWWLEGLEVLRERYYQGVAAHRPYSYFIWANLACTVAVAGLAPVAGLRRAFGSRGTAVGVLALAALAAIVVADLSGMSKAETERIWLPFILWLLPAAALLPEGGRRWWLGGQAVVALAVNHLLLTGW